ncbi:non-ribosomal peptide synthase domain TIGR01720/amino acid adenylation domain-containing protein [Paenibacillus sophorae]|uniref:Non-ribosomal peptide synthase domain TIGR01720/amino acid adenylation domain-containing protein n=1 Tax=Paenibacillus sophorae TaxID=1333845 RepID=A0A1H8PQ15_9BACL|nr:non-ribosomal peptide synthetase [Paenibacillus sophorae]QWU16643.1 non-ribosomal peptide synthetase [Paenibacillus sophorae]SEO43623.1 non-ribosomal peptide synthase domain TIGR01720/amino acid adenylation domain-containing protein [Paenibacillus sophorae]
MGDFIDKKIQEVINDLDCAMNDLPIVEKSGIVIVENEISIPPLHLDDIFAKEDLSHSSKDNVQDDNLPYAATVQSMVKGEMKPALSYGGTLEMKPDHPSTLQMMLKDAADNFGDNGITFVYTDGSAVFISYAELLHEAECVLGGLKRLGLKPGDPVIFQFKDNQKIIISFWACILGGFLPTLIGIAPIYTEMNAVVNKLFNSWLLLSRPVILTERDLEGRVTALRNLWGEEEIWITSYENLRESHADHEWFKAEKESFVLNLLTSGSTGKPKCVQHRNGSLVWRTIATSVHNGFDHHDISLNWMPLDHVGGIVMFHVRDVYLGCNQIIGQIDSVLTNPLIWLDWIDHFKATITWAPNFAFSMLNDAVMAARDYKWDLSSMKYLLNGGEAVVGRVAHHFLNLLRPFNLPANAIVPAYGMSETSSGIVESRLLLRDSTSGIHYIDKYSLSGAIRHVSADSPNHLVFTESGVPLPGVTLRIVDAANNLLNEGNIGRLQVKSPSVMNGYYMNEEANNEVFIDGWFDTGDLGFLIDGKLTVTGRVKDVIIINGNNHYNYDIEAAIEEVDGIEVTFVAACAVPNDQNVDQLAIFFVPTENTETDLLKLIQKLKNTVGRKFGLHSGIFIPLEKESFPKTNSGKIQRAELIEKYKNGDFKEIKKQVDILLKNENTLPDWFYRRKWVTSEQASLFTKDTNLGEHTLVFAEANIDLPLEIKRATLVFKGERFNKAGSTLYYINPYHPEDYQKLIKCILEDQTMIEHVVHLWNLGEGIKQIADVNELKESQVNSSYSLIYLTQALDEYKHDKINLFMVTSHAVAAMDDEAIAYEQSTISGLIKTIPHEFPYIHPKQVDILGSEFGQLLMYINRELVTHDNQRVIAYRNQERMIPVIEKIDLTASAYCDSPLKKNGLYLVTGGLGGIGIVICEHLLKNYSAKLLIVGRTSLSSGSDSSNKRAGFEHLKSLEPLGGSVMYKAADLTNEKQMSALISEFENMSNQSLTGVIHLAGIIQECLIKDQTRLQLEEMYAAKVYGTWVLHQIIKDKKNILFISSSSARTIHAGITVGAYCSANQFMETFAVYQNQFPNIQAYCFSWSLWDETGMGGGLIIKNLLNKRGYSPIEQRKGLFSFLAGIKCQEPVQFIGLNGAKKEIQELSQTSIKTNYKLKIYIQTKVNKSLLKESFHVFKEVAASSMGTMDLPVELELIDQLPLDGNGDIDHRALTKLCTQVEQKYSEPRNELDQILINRWEKILGLSQITIQDHFFELGGNSLQATQLVSALRSDAGVSLELEDLFNFPELMRLSDILNDRLHKEQTSSSLPILPGTYGRQVQTSSAQKRQWILYELEPDNPFYNNTVVIHLKGRIHLGYMERSIEEVVRKHEVLRTTFNVIYDQPAQIIHDYCSVKPQMIDLSSLTEEQRTTTVDTLIKKESMKPFDLVEGPVCRFMLIKTAEDECTFIVSIHHIVSDGWSVGIFVKEFSGYYFSMLDEQEPVSDKLRIQYADYAIWQEAWAESEECRQQLDYWKQQLKGELPVLDLPTDKPRPDIQTYKGKVEVLNIGSGLVENLKKVAHEEGATLYMILLAGFAALLKRYSNQEELILGSLFANRNRVEVEPLIGFFTNTLPLRLDCRGTFREFLRHVKLTVLDAQKHQDVQFEQLLDHLSVERDPGRHPLFQTMFVLQNAPMKPMSSADTEIEVDIYYNETSKFDLSMQIFEVDEELKVILEYNTDLYIQSTMQRMLTHYRTILEAAVCAPSHALDSLGIVTQTERAQILKEWQTPLEDQMPQNGETLITLFERGVKAAPDRCALVYQGKQMTYREVNEQSNKLALFLRQQGVEKEEIIGIMAERSFEMVIGVLAILKSGCAYMPIDPGLPAERIRYMIGDSGTEKILTQRKFADRVKADAAVFELEDAAIYAGNGDNQEVKPSPGQLAYVIYTSGTTGNPKGVMIEHASVVNIILDLQEKNPLEETDAYLFKTPVTFDVSVAELFGWFHGGGRLVILGQGAEKEPLSILQAIDAYRITHINFVPSMLNAFMNTLEEHEYPLLNQLKYVFAAGEALSAEIAKHFFRITSGVRLENIYGPTESTIYATRYSLKENNVPGSIPIGAPMRNIGALILNSCNELQPVGVIGELCIGGAGLARGYINNEELTRMKFTNHPLNPGHKLYRTGDLARWTADGQIEYLGRMDHQVKIRGIRIELIEIELAIMNHDRVQDCVVTALDDHHGVKRLAAYMVLHTTEKIDWPDYLKDVLPEYMIPHYFMILETLPTNQSGKIDRKALPQPDLSQMDEREDYIAPLDEVERMLAGIWGDLLGVHRVGREDDFFKLGGDSIAVIQMISRLRKRGYQLEPKLVYLNKTIAQLTRKIVKTAVANPYPQEDVTGEIILTPIQQWFFGQEFANPQFWNLPALIHLPVHYPEEIVKKAILMIVNHHDALRINFLKREGKITQYNATVVEDIQLGVIDCINMTDESQAAVILKESSRIQGALQFGKGLLIAPLLFNCGDGTQQLLLAAHHLIVDGVSWRIITEDLKLVLDALYTNSIPALPLKTTSFKDWADAQYLYAQSAELQAELPYWKQIIKEIRSFTTEIPSDPGVEGDGVTVQITIDKAWTQKLMRSAHTAYNTEMNDLLLTALYRAAQKSTGREALSFMLEGHGRENIIRNADVSRTVGWFTSSFPVVLKEHNDAVSEQIKGIKETLRGIPNKGIGFGILQYLTTDVEFDDYDSPQILFNYLGQMDGGSASLNVELASVSTGMFHSSAAKRPYLIEFNSMVRNDELLIRVSMNRAIIHHDFMTELISSFEREIVYVTDHCVNAKHREFTASDFPLVQMYQDELKKLSPLTEDAYPLSPMQQGMLYHALSEDRTSSYHGRLYVTLQGRPDQTVMQKAWDFVVDRHPILRTTYLWEGRNEPIQLVRKGLTHPVEYTTFTGEHEKRHIISGFTDQPFNLEDEAPARILLVSDQTGSHQLIWSYHHIALDGWSVFILLSELLYVYHCLYTGQRVSLPFAPHYKEYIQWYLAQDRVKAKAFWKGYLEGIKDATPLPGINPKPTADSSLSQREMIKQAFSINIEITSRILEFTKKEQFTLNTLLQAAWGLLLGRYTGREDVLYGFTVSGRPHTLDDVEKMVGIFINSLPLRLNLASGNSLAGLLGKIQETTLDIKDYEYSLLPEIQEMSEIPYGQSLFHSLLIYQNYPVDKDMTNPERTLKLNDVQGTVDINYDLILEIAPRDRTILFEVYFNQTLWNQSFIGRLFSHFQNVLVEFVSDYQREVKDISILSAQERNTILQVFAREAKVETLYEDQVEIYQGVNDPDRRTKIYILDEFRHPVPIGIPGEVYVASEDIYKDCGSWAEWMEENAIENPFSNIRGKNLYKTGDVGMWEENGTVKIIDLV